MAALLGYLFWYPPPAWPPQSQSQSPEPPPEGATTAVPERDAQSDAASPPPPPPPRSRFPALAIVDPALGESIVYSPSLELSKSPPLHFEAARPRPDWDPLHVAAFLSDATVGQLPPKVSSPPAWGPPGSCPVRMRSLSRERSAMPHYRVTAAQLSWILLPSGRQAAPSRHLGGGPECAPFWSKLAESTPDLLVAYMLPW